MNTPANPNKALWEKGDFTRIADTMRESGEALVQRLGISKGLKVLDLGCGDGTTALPEAKLGADVSGIIGFATLRFLDIKLDYRDGLVFMEYKGPKWLVP